MSKVSWFAAAIITLVLILAPSGAGAATYYVDPAGSDTGAGSDIDPWATLQHAADTVIAGDTVIVQAGTYAPFELTTSGAAGARIEFVADPGVTVTDEINLEGVSYVTVQGFAITGSWRAGIRAVEGEHVWLLDNHAYDNYRWGIFTGCCADLLIEGNECSGSEDEHGIYVSNSGDRPTIRDNVLWGNNANGLHMNGDINTSCTGNVTDTNGIISDALVEANVIYDNGVGGGSGINCDGVNNSTFINNLVYAAHASGMSLYQIDGGGPSTGNLVVNNTIFVAADGRWAMNIQDGATNNTLYNNILLTLHASRGSIDISADSVPGLVSDYNVVTDRFSEADNWIGLTDWQTSTGQDANSILATPAEVFADPSTDDYHLVPTGPAVDNGTATSAPNVDLDGNPRPVGAGYDIGAYEHCEGTECDVVVEDCDNGTDDDGDGDADCDDSDCASSPACQTAEVCDNGTDDDGDGDADCDDSDCASHASCQPGAEVCDNGTDDDGDGDTDCADADCADHAACADSGDDGCGCRTTGSPGSALWLLLALIWLARRRYRRAKG